MDNSGFLPGSIGMNIANSAAAAQSSGQFLQQLPGIQQILTQNVSSKPTGTQNVLQPVIGQQQAPAGNQTVLSQTDVQSIVGQTGNQAFIGQQQQLLAQQQMIGQRGLYATNYQLVPRNYAVVNQPVQGTGVTIQLSPQQVGPGTNLATLSPIEHQQFVQAATFDSTLSSLQNQNQAQFAFQNSNGQLTLQSPTQQLTLQSPTQQLALQSPPQQLPVPNQNQYLLQNQNIPQLNPLTHQVIPAQGQNNSVIVQGQSPGNNVLVQGQSPSNSVLVQGQPQRLIVQGEGQNLILPGQGFNANLTPSAQAVNTGQVFGQVPNLGSHLLPNQVQGLYTQASVLTNQNTIMNNVNQSQTVKMDNSSNQARSRRESGQKKSKVKQPTVQNPDVATINQQMQLLAQIANQGLVGVASSQPSPLLANLPNQNAAGASVLNQTQSLPSFGHFLLHHHQQQLLPHPFLQNTNLGSFGLQQAAAMPNVVSGQPQQPPANVASSLILTPGVSSNNTVRQNAGNMNQSSISPQDNNLNTDFNNWNIGQFHQMVRSVQSRVTSTGPVHGKALGVTSPKAVPIASPAKLHSHGQKLGTNNHGSAASCSGLSTKTDTSLAISNAVSTAIVSTVSNIVSKCSGTQVTYGPSTISISKVLQDTTTKSGAKLCSDTSLDGSQSACSVTKSIVKQEPVDPVMLKPGMSAKKNEIPVKTVLVPHGWVRSLEGDSVVYYSPTCARLTSVQNIKQYLATEGTCKCGLECPVLVETVFNFDPAVMSVKTLPGGEVKVTSVMCHHRQKVVSMTMFPMTRSGFSAGRPETSVVTSSKVMMSPRVSSTVQEVKQGQTKRKPCDSAGAAIFGHAPTVSDTPSQNLLQVRNVPSTSTNKSSSRHSPGVVTSIHSPVKYSGTNSPARKSKSPGRNSPHATGSASPRGSGGDKAIVSKVKDVAKCDSTKASDEKETHLSRADCEAFVARIVEETKRKLSQSENAMQSGGSNSSAGTSSKKKQKSKKQKPNKAVSSDGNAECTTSTSVGGIQTNANSSSITTTAVSSISEAGDVKCSIIKSAIHSCSSEESKGSSDSTHSLSISQVTKEKCQSPINSLPVLKTSKSVAVSNATSTSVVTASSLDIDVLIGTPAKVAKKLKPTASLDRTISPSKEQLHIKPCSLDHVGSNPSRPRSATSNSSNSSKLSSEVVSPSSEIRSSSRSSEKDHSGNEQSQQSDAVGQFLNYSGFENTALPYFHQRFPGGPGVVNKLSAMRAVSPGLHQDEKQSTVKSPGIMVNSVGCSVNSQMVTNMHNLVSPPNQQVFSPNYGMSRFPLLGHGPLGYQHGASINHRSSLDSPHSIGNQRFPTPGADLGLPFGNLPIEALTANSAFGNFAVLSDSVKIKSKKLNNKEKEKKLSKDSIMLCSESPPPNIDVSVLKDKGHGHIPKQKIASFMENPAEFLKQQTALVNSSISSTSASPKHSDNLDTSLEDVPVSESDSMEITVGTKRSESANSDRRSCSPCRSEELRRDSMDVSELAKHSDANAVKKVVVNELELPAVSTESVVKGDASSSISVVQKTIVGGSIETEQKGVCSSALEVSRPSCSTPPTPTTVVHHTPVSLSCHQLSLNKAKQHELMGKEPARCDLQIKDNQLHPLAAMLSDPTIGQAFQKIFPQAVQDALFNSIGLTDIASSANLKLSSQVLNNIGGVALPSLSSPSTTVSSAKVTDSIGRSVPVTAGASSVSSQAASINLLQAVSNSQPNFPIHQLLNQQAAKGDFPASTLLSAAARAQLVQQQQIQKYMSLIMAQQMGEQICNPPAAKAVVSCGQTGQLIQGSASSSSDIGNVPVMSTIGSFPAISTVGVSSVANPSVNVPCSGSNIQNANSNSVTCSTTANVDSSCEKTKVTRPGSAKISEILNKMDPDRLKQKVVTDPRMKQIASSMEIPLLTQVQNQNASLSSNVLSTQQPSAMLPNVPQACVDINQLIMNQIQAAASENFQHSNIPSVQPSMPSASNFPEQEVQSLSLAMMAPQLMQLYTSLGVPLQGNAPPASWGPSTTQGQNFPINQLSPFMVGQMPPVANQQGINLPMMNSNAERLPNINPNLLCGQQVPSAAQFQNSQFGNLVQQDSSQMSVPNANPMVANINGNQVLVNVPGINNLPIDGRTVGMPNVQLNPNSSSSVVVMPNAPAPVVQMVGPNQISISHSDKSSVQQLTLTNQGIDIQNIVQPNPSMQCNAQVNSDPSVQMQNPNQSQIMPVNLINVQQSFGGGSNLTAMQLHTLQLQQQLLQQIQQVQGMQNLINQCNLQGIGTNSLLGVDKDGNLSLASSSGLGFLSAGVSSTPCGITAGVSIPSAPIQIPSAVVNHASCVLSSANTVSETLLHSTVTKPSSFTVSSGAGVPMPSVVSPSTPKQKNIPEPKVSTDDTALKRSNVVRVIAAADTTADCNSATKTVDIGTETEDFHDVSEDNESDSGADNSQNVEISDVLKGREASSSNTEKNDESLDEPVVVKVQQPQVSTCLAIATQKGNDKSSELENANRLTMKLPKSPTESKASSGSLKLKLSRKQLTGSTTSDNVCKSKKHKLMSDSSAEPKLKFEKKELRSSTAKAVATCTTASCPTSVSDDTSVSKQKVHAVEDKVCASDRNIDLLPSTSIDVDKSIEPPNDEAGRMQDVITECDSSSKDTSCNTVTTSRKDDSSVEENSNKQCELTSKIAAALSDQKGLWQLRDGQQPSTSGIGATIKNKSAEEDAVLMDPRKTDASRIKTVEEEKGTKRQRSEVDAAEETASEEEEAETEESPVTVQHVPRSFNTGDLVWGQIRGFPSWPGKLVDWEDVKPDLKADDGKLLVQWFGDHTITQVEPNKLKTLSEGLEAHHRARRKHRKGRKMNSNLEQAIQQAMAELDRQSSSTPEGERIDTCQHVQKPGKKKQKK